ncbi:MAG: VOC family protein [Bacteriovorax sp.]|nr:VOC family protein [Bacteriovorax sp.]
MSIIPSSICYVEIPAPDIEKARIFYSSLFNWEILQSELTDQKYYMFKTGENSLMGGLDSTKSVSDQGVLLYLKVEKIISTLEMIEKSGGKVVRTKFEIGGGYGFSAVFADPNGNHLGLWSEK